MIGTTAGRFRTLLICPRSASFMPPPAPGKSGREARILVVYLLPLETRAVLYGRPNNAELPVILHHLTVFQLLTDGASSGLPCVCGRTGFMEGGLLRLLISSPGRRRYRPRFCRPGSLKGDSTPAVASPRTRFVHLDPTAR